MPTQNYLLDACALLAFYDSEEGADVVSGLIDSAERGAFQQSQKCGGEKPHKGQSPTGFCGNRAPEGGEAHTILDHSYIYFIFNLNNFIYYFFHILLNIRFPKS